MKNLLTGFIMMLLFFASNAQPTIISFSPKSGPAGTIDTINGIGFNIVPTNNIVYYGATRATLIQATPVRLIVRVPTGATYQPISVTVGGLTGYSQLPFIIKSGNKVLPSIGQISFDNKFYVNDPHMPVLVSSVDLDGDSKPDIAVSNSDSTVSIYRNTSTSGTISMGTRMDIQIKTPIGSYGGKGITYGDIDGDGKQDIIASDYKNNLYSISIFRNTSSVGFISFAAKVEYFTAERSLNLTVIDVDSDGKSDIVVSNDFGTSSSTFSVFRNTSSIGNISLATRVDITAGSDTRGVSVGDLDGDGKPDLIVLNYGGSSSFSVFRNTCSPGNISFTLVSNIAFNSPQWISLCDLDGDGKLDVIISGQSFPIFYYKNTSTIGSITLSGGIGFAGGNGSIVRNSFGDLNGDGKLETITFGSIIPNLSTPGNFLFGQINFYAGSSSTIIDFDGDGLNDIISFYYDTISIYRNNGTYPIIKSISPDSGKKNTNITMNVICSDVNFKSLSSKPQLQFKLNGSISNYYTLIKDTILNDTTIQYVFKFNNGAAIGKYSVVLNHSLFSMQMDSAFTLLANTGIEESNTQSHTFTIIPNPNTGKFEIVSSNTLTELEIFDVRGNKVFSSFPNSTSIKIDFSELRKGIYFVKSITENFVSIKKILIE
ncbi:MAG: FG-GAP-like repeat-containing protein [Bacteroidota bacterium]